MTHKKYQITGMLVHTVLIAGVVVFAMPLYGMVVTALKTDIDLHELAELHRPLLEALGQGSPGKAGEALRQHFELLRTMMKRGEGA